MNGFEVFLFFAILGGGALYLIFVLPAQLRGRERTRLYELLKYGYDKGQPVPPDLIRELMRRPMPTRDRDIRWGAVILSVAIGVALCGFVMIALWQWAGFHDPPRTWLDGRGNQHIDYDNDMRNSGIIMMVMGILPACVGFTFLMLGLTKRRDDT